MIGQGLPDPVLKFVINLFETYHLFRLNYFCLEFWKSVGFDSSISQRHFIDFHSKTYFLDVINVTYISSANMHKMAAWNFFQAPGQLPLRTIQSK